VSAGGSLNRDTKKPESRKGEKIICLKKFLKTLLHFWQGTGEKVVKGGKKKSGNPLLKQPIRERGEKTRYKKKKKTQWEGTLQKTQVLFGDRGRLHDRKTREPHRRNY